MTRSALLYKFVLLFPPFEGESCLKNNLTEVFPSFQCSLHFVFPRFLAMVMRYDYRDQCLSLYTSCHTYCCLHDARGLLTLVFDSRSDDQKRVYVPVALLTSGIRVESLMGQRLKLHKVRAIIALHTPGQKGSSILFSHYIS